MIERTNVQAFVFTNNPIFKLLILKRIPERSGYWQPVCGGIENGERSEEAVIREVFEETGITKIKDIIDLNYEFTYRESKNGKPMYMKDICYAVEIDDAIAIKLSNEHGACRVITNLGDYQDSKHLHWHLVYGSSK